MDEFKLGKQQERGARSSEILNNDTLKAAFAALEAEYLKAWRYTHINDVNGRERLFQAVHIVNKVQDHLKTWVDHGKLATKELASIKYIKR